MRFDICGQFVVNVVTPKGGWSKGRPIALIEETDRWSVADLLLPNDLSDEALESFIADKFSSFAVTQKPIRRLDSPPQASKRRPALAAPQ
jgi:hypothetical protein